MEIFRWLGDETIYIRGEHRVIAHFRTCEGQMEYEDCFEDGTPVERTGEVQSSLLTSHNVERLI